MKKNEVIIPEIILKSIDQKWLNVFLFNSSIQAVIARLIILKYKIDKENVLLVPQRKTDLSLFKKFKCLFTFKGEFDNYIDKLFFHNSIGARINKAIKKTNQKFLIYTPMASKEANFLISKKNCCGHIYLENGQHSWMKQSPYNHSKIDLFMKYKLNWSNRMVDGFRYRNDSHAYIGIHKNSFPDIIKNKKYILRDISALKKYYQQKLTGRQIIGLTCASRRLKKGELKSMLKRLFKKLPEGSIVKPHPSFTADTKTFKNFRDVFSEVGKGKYKLCPENVILELEMLYQKKKIVGPQSSLSEYADLFGSSFKQVNIY